MKLLWKIIKRVLQGIAIVVALFFTYLLIVGLIPGLSVPQQPLETIITKDRGKDNQNLRKNVSFTVNGSKINAWFYDSNKKSPCIIMAHGFGGTKDIGLDGYAQEYQRAGYSVLVFDYRFFGTSEGDPRQLAWIPYQLEDYRGAIDYAKKLKNVDENKIILWGTSLSGGHVIVLAGENKNIAGVIAQCPFVDGFASAMSHEHKEGEENSPYTLIHAQRDLVRSWFGLSAHKIPIVGQPGTVALLTDKEAFNAYSSLASENFVNEICARIAIRADKYRPVKSAKKVKCPVLLQICEKDSIIPLSAGKATVRELGRFAHPTYYPIRHFDIYFGKNKLRAIKDQLEFLSKNI